MGCATENAASLMQFCKPENYFTVREALIQAGMGDLIGGCKDLERVQQRREAVEKEADRSLFAGLIREVGTHQSEGMLTTCIRLSRILFAGAHTNSWSNAALTSALTSSRQPFGWCTFHQRRPWLHVQTHLASVEGKPVLAAAAQESPGARTLLTFTSLPSTVRISSIDVDCVKGTGASKTNRHSPESPPHASPSPSRRQSRSSTRPYPADVFFALSSTRFYR